MAARQGRRSVGGGLDEEGAGGGAVKKGGAKCPYNHQKSKFKECGEYNRIRSKCKPVLGLFIDTPTFSGATRSPWFSSEDETSACSSALHDVC